MNRFCNALQVPVVALVLPECVAHGIAKEWYPALSLQHSLADFLLSPPAQELEITIQKNTARAYSIHDCTSFAGQRQPTHKPARLIFFLFGRLLCRVPSFVSSSSAKGDG